MNNKYVKFALVSIAYGIALLLINLVHSLFFRVNVVFYSAIFDGFLALIVPGILLFFVFKLFNQFEITVILIFLLLGGYTYAISIPTVIDRSLSFYILEKLQQRGGAIPVDDFDDVFRIDYVKEHRLVDVRLTEQSESGTIEIKGNIVYLTKKGETLATMSRFYRKHFLPKKRLLMGEYSDDLTDPFKNTAE